MADYVPRKEAPFFDWQNNFAQIVGDAPPAWGLPADEVTALLGKQTTYVNAYALGNAGRKATRTTEQVKNKNDAQKVYVENIRLFVKRFINNNPGVTNGNRSQLGLPEVKKGRTPSPTPTAIPNVSEEPLQGARFKVAAKEALNGKTLGKNGKPAGVSGFELAYWVGDNPPVNGDTCWNKIRSNRTMVIVQLDATDATKRITFFMRWIGMKNQTGPWSAGVTDVITM